MTEPHRPLRQNEFPYPDITMRLEGFTDNIIIGDASWIAPNATLTGTIQIGKRASIWYNCVLRGDVDQIVIGDETNIQDGTIIHCDEMLPTVIGDRVTVGHMALIHGCRIEDDALIGMGAIVLDGAVIGKGAVIAAGAVVREHTIVAPYTLYAGVPAKERGTVKSELSDRFAQNCKAYVNYAYGYRLRSHISDDGIVD